MTRKHALITGGAGFIGGHIAEGLAAEGHEITVLDNFEPYYDLGIKEHNVDTARRAAENNGGEYELVDDSITNAEVVDDLVSDIDVLYHQAAQAGVRKSVEEPAKVNSYNMDGTINVLEAARKHDIERAVIASSSSVYGKPEYLPYDEGHPTTPVSPYGVSKLATEQYARVYNEIYGLPTVSLRYFTVYGHECARTWRSRTSSRGVSTANPQSSMATAHRHVTSRTKTTSSGSTDNFSLTTVPMERS